jgi:hypothetical protein
LWTGLAIGRLLSIAVSARAHAPQGGLQVTKEDVAAYRLGEVCMGTTSHGARPGRRIRVSRDDDDRHRGTETPQMLQQVKPAMARHAQIGHQASEPVRDIFRHEGLRSIESATR